MDYILNVHTATETALVNLCAGQKVLATLLNTNSKQHAAWLHTGIQQLLKENGLHIQQLQAIGVTVGPGSYTGIRVGLATVKGLCYALKIPLITFNTLEVLSLSAANTLRDKHSLYCPMIDARRMEVFTAIYTHDVTEIMPPSATIVTEHSFVELLTSQSIYFFGNGSEKFKAIATNVPSSYFINQEITSEGLCSFAWLKYQRKEFNDPAYSEPLYIKEFYSPGKIEK